VSGDGQTVAHIAVENNNLPEDFKDWHIVDSDGCTVAHKAVYYKNLPKDFGKDNPSIWDIVSNSGVTVREVYDKYYCTEISSEIVIDS
jgi:hypothetical protein